MMKSAIAMAITVFVDAENATDTCSSWACLQASDCTGTPPAMYVCSPDAQCVNYICQDGSGPPPTPTPPSPIPAPGQPDGPDEHMSVTISYEAPESCKSKGINHYRLTMDANVLLLIGVDKNENPIDTSDPEPHDFQCQNDGLFDQLQDKRDCLKLEAPNLVSNRDDASQNPCVLDSEHCHVEGSSKTWKFEDLGQTWCMGKVDAVDGCGSSYSASAFPPLNDLSQCSDKWNVKKIWKGRKGQAELHNSVSATCSDCTQSGANFQCLTSKGCSSAANQDVCTGLSGGGTWCAAPSTGQCFHDSTTNACGACTMEYECGNYDTSIVKCFAYPDPQCHSDMLV